MDSARWYTVRRVLQGALEIAPEGRARYLAEACVGDGELRGEVESLLEAEASGRSLEPPELVWSHFSAALTAGARIGARIGHYRILRVIGYGGMGQVYEAEQEHPKRTVALKMIRPGLASPRTMRRFEFEVQTMARLRHPCIAQVFEAGAHSPDPADPACAVPYFAMEYIPDALPITAFAQDRSLSTRQRLELFAQVCDAVHHGHQNGVIHRDLKPGNILVDAEGQPKIIDFGVARTIDPDVAAGTLHASGEHIVGTLQYMSPEQCSGDRDELDTRSDVYSLGVVLYELLAGSPPHELSGLPITDALRLIREKDPLPLGALARDLRGDVETIVRAAMEKERTRRYPAASALAADIRHFLRSEPIAARPPTVRYQLRVFARRNKALVAGVVAVFVVLTLGVVSTGIALVQARIEAHRSRRIADFFKQTISAGNPYLPSGIQPAGLNWWEDPPVQDSTRPTGASPGRDFSVVDLVQLAGERLGSSFEDEPIIRGELFHALGRTLAHLGRDGLPLLQRALEARELAFGPDHEETIRTRMQVAELIESGGSYAAAEPNFRAAWEASQRAFGAMDARTLEIAARLVVNLQWHRPGEVLALAQRNVEDAMHALGADHPVTLRQAGGLIGGLLYAGRQEEAEDAARQSLEGFRRTTGEESFETAGARIVLASALRRRGAFAEAEEHLLVGLAVLRARSTQGISDGTVFYGESERLAVLRRMGRFSEAVLELRRRIELAKTAFGPQNHNVYKLQSQLARTLLDSGSELQEAEELARRTLEDWQRQPGAMSDLNAVMCADTLHGTIRARGRPKEAEELARELLRFLDTTEVTEPIVLLAVHHTLGECLMDQGRLDEAESHLLAAWSHANPERTFNDPYDPRRLTLLRTLGRLFEATGERERAAEFRCLVPPDASGR